MHRTAISNGFVDSATQHAILEEITIVNRFSDTRKILINHAASANVHVANFRVAHLAIWKANRHSRGLNASIWIIF